MRTDARPEQLIGKQVRYLVWHRLLQKIFTVIAIHLPIEAQQVAAQISDTGALPAQVDIHPRAWKAAIEPGFRELVAIFETRHEFIHGAHYKMRARPGNATGSKNTGFKTGGHGQPQILRLRNKIFLPITFEYHGFLYPFPA